MLLYVWSRKQNYSFFFVNEANLVFEKEQTFFDQRSSMDKAKKIR